MGNTITNSLVFVIFLSFLGTSVTAVAQSEDPSKGSVKRNLKARASKASAVHHKALFGLAVWGDQFSIEASDGRSEKVLAEYTGLSIRYEGSKEWALFGASFGLQALILQGVAQAQGQTITYKESTGTVTPLMADLGGQIRPHKNVSLGLSLGVMNYQLRLNQPASTMVASYQFKYTKPIQTFGHLRLAWDLTKDLLLQQTLFVAESNSRSPGWTLSMGYKF